MSTIDLQITDSSDDCVFRIDEVGDPSVSLVDATVNFYSHNFLGSRESGMRFKKVGIPQGATISAAYITLTSDGNNSGTDANSRLIGEAANFSIAFTTHEDYSARATTSASIAWSNMEAWTLDTEYNSPSIVTIIQEIVDRSNWQPGGSITIFWQDNNSSNGVYRSAYSLDGSAAKAPKLHIEYTASTTATIKQVAASADDCYVYYNSGDNPAISLTNSGQLAGYGTSNAQKLGGGMRFLNVAIAQGAVIDCAYLVLTASSDAASTTVNTKIRGENTADASAFSTVGNYTGRTRTSAYVDWNNIDTWTQDVEYASPDIGAVVQEIVDRVQWATGNDIVIFWDDHDGNSTTSGGVNYRLAYSYNGSTTKCPVLYIEYHTITSPARDSVKTAEFTVSKKVLEFS